MQGPGLAKEAVLVGSAEKVQTALQTLNRWAPADVSVRAAALVGEGEASLPVVARAPNWTGLNFQIDAMSIIVLVEPPPSPEKTRAFLKRAADARKKVLLLDGGKLRTLTINDLVGRHLGAVDWKRIQEIIASKRVLITGGGGSIGAELARRVAGLGATRLTILDSSEFNLFRIGHELPEATIVLADVRDVAAIKRWFTREKPDIVFHAAALKQVPLVEQFPSEGVLTNVSGTKHVADACQTIGADLIFVSTDKAVDPSGVMGASKRLGELYCQAIDRLGGKRAIPVRLGNVLGSAGSVTPIFESQLAAGGPLTITDAEVTRFFLSIPQAADVLLQAAAVGISADATRGAAMVIDMGEALPVVELARDMIRLEGLRPEIDVPITFVGLRPGEKLHEALIAANERRAPEPAPGVMVAHSAARAVSDLTEIFQKLAQLASAGQEMEAASLLFAAVNGARALAAAE